jgi:predicted phage-related endonuclease
VQNGRKVSKLYLIWLPQPQYGTAMVKELQRIPSEICQYVVACYVAGGDPLSAVSALVNYLPKENSIHKRVKGEIPDAVHTVVEELMMVKQQLDELTALEKELKKQVLEAMQGVGEDTWSNDLIQISRKAAYERESVDTKTLKADHPDLYEQYKKITKVSESLTYKLL